LNKNRKIYECPIATFAESYLLAQGISFPLDDYQKAYLDIKQKGQDTEMFDSLQYIFGTSLLDIIVLEFDTFKKERSKDYKRKIKMYNERQRN